MNHIVCAAYITAPGIEQSHCELKNGEAAQPWQAEDKPHL
jgi:hypothetical protein